MNAKSTQKSRFIIVIALLSASLAYTLPVEAAAFIVNTSDDLNDGRCDTRHCSLREAIDAANTNPGSDTISFNIPGVGPHVIALASRLMLTGNGTTIDGTTQPGYTGTPLIILDGEAVPMLGFGFEIESGNNVLRGLTFVRFSNTVTNPSGAIVLYGPSNLIEQNYFGADPSGVFTTEAGNTSGIHDISLGRNTIQGNYMCGNIIGVVLALGAGDIFQGNYIGSDPSGICTGNNLGLAVSTASDVLIGGMEPGERNIISSNEVGINLSGTGPYSTRSVDFNISVVGNYIGTDASGSVAVPNQTGILVDTNSRGVHIESNLISGNTQYGIRLLSEGNELYGNWIGTNAAGNAALGNRTGILVEETGTLNRVGGYTSSQGNVIAASTGGHGLVIRSDRNNIIGNKIGTNVLGDTPLPNHAYGVWVEGSHNSIIDNLISGNIIAGIGLWYSASDNQVTANIIGADASGTVPIPNYAGLEITGHNNLIGEAGEGNLIQYNSQGIILTWLANGNHIYNNTIAENNQHGVYLVTTTWAPDDTVYHNTISRNSIYDNGGLGIEIVPGLNDDIPIPVVTSRSTAHVEGLTCPGCRIEIFLADPDPSGYGEGRTFVTETTADDDGVFNTALSGLGICDAITTTATDASGNTSEFSRYLHLNCYVVPPLFILGGIPIFTLIGIPLGLFIGRARGRRALPSGFAGAVVGGLVGAGLIGLAVILPMVHIEQFPGQPAPEGPPGVHPPCEQFLSADAFSPANDALFNPGTDVLIQLLPQPDLPDIQTRWQFIVQAPDGDQRSLTPQDASVLLSELGFNLDLTGTYFWRVDGEMLEQGSNKWQFFCTGRAERSFSMFTPQIQIPAPLEGVTPQEETPKPTTTPTSTPSACLPTAIALQNATCRYGPDKTFKDLGYLLQGESASIAGRNAQGSWWWILNPDADGHCWVAANLVEVDCETSGVPVVQGPPTPTSTKTPVQGCWVWNANLQKNVCTVPCPPNPQPGGTCTP